MLQPNSVLRRTRYWKIKSQREENKYREAVVKQLHSRKSSSNKGKQAEVIWAEAEQTDVDT